ncbi:MAG: methyltransferase domain-containing protein [Phycisphaerales bacterium]
MQPTTSARRRPTLYDWIALGILKVAKARRTRLESTNPDDYDKFYEEFFAKKDQELSFNDPRMARRRKTILECLNRRLPPGASILDAGCGLGEVLADIPDQYKLFGFDFAKSNVEFTKRRLGDRADVKQGSIYEIPFPDNSMDAVLCLEVLEHIEDDARGVRDIARVLRPGGVLIVAVPYTFYWPSYLKLMGHFRHYTRQSLAAMLRENGLDPVEVLPNFPRWHQSYTRHYVKLRALVLTVGKLFGGGSMFAFRWPWHKERAIDRLETRMQSAQDRDAALDYTTLDTSTFQVAQKPLA